MPLMSQPKQSLTFEYSTSSLRESISMEYNSSERMASQRQDESSEYNPRLDVHTLEKAPQQGLKSKPVETLRAANIYEGEHAQRQNNLSEQQHTQSSVTNLNQLDRQNGSKVTNVSFATDTPASPINKSAGVVNPPPTRSEKGFLKKLKKKFTEKESSKPSANFASVFSLNHVVAKVNIDALTSDDVIIAIMGPTGAGKSSFINTITNSEEQVGHTLESCTSEIRAVKLAGPDIGDLNLVFVDTPGFDDTFKTDLEILKLISDWLERTYSKTIKLAGILYLHRISDNRMAGSSLKNLTMFENLCGKRALGNVIFGTTMWDDVDEQVGERRQKELIDTYFKPMRKKGSQVFRYDNTPESAWHIIDHFVDDRFATLLQEELVTLRKTLEETEAGRALYSDLQMIARKQAETAKMIREQMDIGNDGPDEVVLTALQEEYDELRKVLAQTVLDMQKLNIPLGKRVLRILWLPRGVRGWIPKDFRQHGPSSFKPQ